ncbi:hypothetical protein HDV05_002619 [Chytridiales sp. JEL 0842]|nr:hypothetical protein HDV05_002619 [Chytridiales sp. JEL 0842]
MIVRYSQDAQGVIAGTVWIYVVPNETYTSYVYVRQMDATGNNVGESFPATLASRSVAPDIDAYDFNNFQTLQGSVAIYSILGTDRAVFNEQRAVYDHNQALADITQGDPPGPNYLLNQTLAELPAVPGTGEAGVGGASGTGGSPGGTGEAGSSGNGGQNDSTDPSKANNNGTASGNNDNNNNNSGPPAFFVPVIASVVSVVVILLAAFFVFQYYRRTKGDKDLLRNFIKSLPSKTSSNQDPGDNQLPPAPPLPSGNGNEYANGFSNELHQHQMHRNSSSLSSVAGNAPMPPSAHVHPQQSMQSIQFHEQHRHSMALSASTPSPIPPNPRASFIIPAPINPRAPIMIPTPPPKIVAAPSPLSRPMSVQSYTTQTPLIPIINRQDSIIAYSDVSSPSVIVLPIRTTSPTPQQPGMGLMIPQGVLPPPSAPAYTYAFPHPTTYTPPPPISSTPPPLASNTKTPPSTPATPSSSNTPPPTQQTHQPHTSPYVNYAAAYAAQAQAQAAYYGQVYAYQAAVAAQATAQARALHQPHSAPGSVVSDSSKSEMEPSKKESGGKKTKKSQSVREDDPGYARQMYYTSS